MSKPLSKIKLGNDLSLFLHRSSNMTGTSVKAFVFSTLGLNFGGQRTCLESYTLTPVNDPRKLELMRCAYQKAVRSCGIGESIAAG